MRIRVPAVDRGIVGKVASGESSVECWYFGTDVGNIVEECARRACKLRYSRLEGKDAY